MSPTTTSGPFVVIVGVHCPCACAVKSAVPAAIMQMLSIRPHVLVIRFSPCSLAGSPDAEMHPGHGYSADFTGRTVPRREMVRPEAQFGQLYPPGVSGDASRVLHVPPTPNASQRMRGSTHKPTPNRVVLRRWRSGLPAILGRAKPKRAEPGVIRTATSAKLDLAGRASLNSTAPGNPEPSWAWVYRNRTVDRARSTLALARVNQKNVHAGTERSFEHELRCSIQ